MNQKAKNIFRNLNYTISANFLVLGISILLNLFVPRFIGVTEYGLWQLYIFYSSYVGFFHLGWLDGIYLRIGGEEYDKLDHRNLGSQFWYLLIFEGIVATILAIITSVIVTDQNLKHIFYYTILVMLVTITRAFIIFIFQATNRIKEYAQISRNDRYIYILLVVAYLFIGGKSFSVLIILDIFSKFIVTVWGMYKIRDMVFLKLLKLDEVLDDIKQNLLIGSNLMLSNIASMMIIGISRVFVERKWSIETFGKLSLTLSLSNMFMTFINAIGVVMFPILRRTDPKKLSSLYLNIRNVFVPFTFIILLSYVPLRAVLEIWLPNYKESLIFMGILFPMIVYEGRVSLLINTYLKTLRKERLILVANIVSVILSVSGSFICVFIIKELSLTVIFIMLSIIFRCCFSEYLLAKYIKINLVKQTLTELFLTFIFIASNMIFEEWISFVIFSGILLIYIFVNRKATLVSFTTLVKLGKVK